METTRSFTLPMPPSLGRLPTETTIETTGPVVVIGANGCGKSRFGDWLERQRPSSVHRVAAQKSLTFPQLIRPPSVDMAENILWFGHESYSVKNPQKGSRWSERPVTSLLDDYVKVVDVLFAEEVERSTEFRRAAKSTTSRVDPPETKLDVVKRIWEHTLPERELIVSGGKVEARRKSESGTLFNASEMSDGERVVFYLIGQALCAPRNAVLVLDEPELHLHRGIQAKLWDDIEAARSDALFIYLTHDLEFAASRVGAKKIWLREFDGKNWEWDEISGMEELPEPLLLRILGSRKSVLFVEGVSGGIDEEVYTHIYPNWTVTPCGSCAHVIHATAVFSAKRSFHRLECRGIVDDDERSLQEKESLAGSGVYLLGFTELENVFLVEGALKIAAAALMPGEDVDRLVGLAKAKILGLLTANREDVISKRVAYRIEERAKHFHTKAQGEAGITAAWDSFQASLVPRDIYASEAALIGRIVTVNDYDAAIRAYPNKGLSHQITSIFGSTNLQQFLRRLLAAPNGKPLREVLTNFLPRVNVACLSCPP